MSRVAFLHAKVVSHPRRWTLNGCWTPALLLAARCVAQRNDDFFLFFSFTAISSWCWGNEHGASGELLTVHGDPVIGAMPADSVSSPSRDWVSRTFDRVTTHRPVALFFFSFLFLTLSLSRHMIFLRLPTSSFSWAWLCVLHGSSILPSRRRHPTRR